ncbi:MAG TPA: hypothetical protein VNC78_08200 [Actinomycetota bacterium]|nr:hypothetical protein [Actinomycetota bacterium]
MARKAAGVALAGSLVAALFAMGATAGADDVSAATGAAFGVRLAGPVPIEDTPAVSASVPKGESDATDDILVVPADPLATSFTAHVEANASVKSSIPATLQGTMDGAASGLPKKWNARGYAITEDLGAVTQQIQADVIESEATAACVGEDVVYSTAARIVNLSVAGAAVPVLNATPNQEVFNQLGIRIVFWETNWDPDTGKLAEGGDLVFANAVHITAPGGIDLIVSHSEARATCGAMQAPKPQCDDDKDNDGDGKIDFPADTGCESKKDDNEKDLPQCSDLIDNDGDGKIDFPADPGCDSKQDDDERDASAPAAEPVFRQPAFTG